MKGSERGREYIYTVPYLRTPLTPCATRPAGHKMEVLDVLNGRPMPEGWNDTVIVLIPKVRNPEKLKELWPISLCNVLYKLVFLGKLW